MDDKTKGIFRLCMVLVAFGIIMLLLAYVMHFYRLSH